MAASSENWRGTARFSFDEIRPLSISMYSDRIRISTSEPRVASVARAISSAWPKIAPATPPTCV